jgi:hypothetical protein
MDKNFCSSRTFEDSSPGQNISIMMVNVNIPPPAGLAQLVRYHDNRHQAAVRFRVPSWRQALAACIENVTELLVDDRYTAPCSSKRFRRLGDRTVSRADVRSACQAMDLNDPEQVLQCFVLVMAWGSGTTGSRGLHNTARALNDPDTACKTLVGSASLLREAQSSAGGALRQAHQEFRLRGVGQSFFTKWFSYAGFAPERTWNPLILDSRVLATLNQTLQISTRTMAGDRRRAARYASYVEHLHGWADELTTTGHRVDSERLEWIMFEHNGEPLPPASDTNRS